MGLGFKELKLGNDDTNSADGSLGKITFTNYDNNGASFAKIEAKSDAALGTDDHPGRLIFSTTPDDSNSLTERMVIKHNGYIGVGTSTPLSEFQIPGRYDDLTEAPQFTIPASSNPRYSVGIGSNHVSGTGQRMDFYVGDSGSNTSNLGNGTRRMVLDSNGVLCLNDDAADSYSTGIQIRSNQNLNKYSFILKSANENGGGNSLGGFFAMMFRNDDSNATTDYNLGIIMKNNTAPYNYHQIGFFNNDNEGGGAFFTGQHRNILNTSINENHVGLIVKSSGNYVNISGNLQPSINESLPICSLVNTDNDPSVFGVISDKEDTENDRTTGSGSFKSVSKKKYTNEQRLYINSLGEGSMWVCNKNGDLVNGDYITSCTIPGYGAKQTTESGTLKNYTVAKITCDCDFPLTQIVKQKIKVIDTTQTLTRNVTATTTINETKTVITYDTVNSRYVQSEVTESKEKVSQVYDTVNLYDTNGNVIGTHQAPRTETYTNTTQQIDYNSNGDVQYEDDLDGSNQQQMIYKYDTRFIQADGTLLTDEADYNTRLANGETVYKACFVGCTYHCG